MFLICTLCAVIRQIFCARCQVWPNVCSVKKNLVSKRLRYWRLENWLNRTRINWPPTIHSIWPSHAVNVSRKRWKENLQQKTVSPLRITGFEPRHENNHKDNYFVQILRPTEGRTNFFLWLPVLFSFKSVCDIGRLKQCYLLHEWLVLSSYFALFRCEK